jgi:hypothetical protein
LKLPKFSLLALLLGSALTLAACGGTTNKDDTTTTSATTTTTTTTTTPSAAVVSNTGSYSGSHDSPNKLLCIDAPGLNPQGHGSCGQRFTLAGSVSFTVEGNVVTGGWVDVYGWQAPLDGQPTIDANGDFSFGFGPGGFVNGRANVTNGVMTGRLQEGPYDWKYGDFTLYKQ